MFTICGTGRRKIQGQYVNSPLNKIARDLAEGITAVLNYLSLFEQTVDIKVISGMALGFDMVLANTVIDLKQSDPVLNLSLECAIPFNNHSHKWSKHLQQWYDYILDFADSVHYTSNNRIKNLSPLFEKRDRYMIDNSDVVISLWDYVEKGGTYKAICYAQKINKPILNIDLDQKRFDFLK